MRKILLVSLMLISSSVLEAQTKNRIWLEWNGYRNINFWNRNIGSIGHLQDNPSVVNSKVVFERNFLNIKDKLIIAAAANITYNRRRYFSFAGQPGFMTLRNFYYGGGVNIKKRLFNSDNFRIYIANTTSWVYTRNDNQAKVIHKNFIENNFGLENSFKISEKRWIALRIMYNKPWDTKFPEPFNDETMFNRVSFGLGYQF